jgi:hypothetical protein
MTTLIEKSILNERLEKSRSGTYADTSENRRKHRVGQKYGSEKKEEEKPEKTDPNKMSPEQQLEAINKVIAAVNEGKLKLPPEEINTLVAKKTMAEEAVKQAKGEKKAKKKSSKEKIQEEEKKRGYRFDDNIINDPNKTKEETKPEPKKEEDRKAEQNLDEFYANRKKEGFVSLGNGNMGKIKSEKSNGDLIVEYARFGEKNWVDTVQRGSSDFKALMLEKNSGSETEESYTRVKFEDVPNSGKVNLKKYLSEKVRQGVDEKWSNIKNIPTDNLKKMEKGLVNDLNKNFEAIKKSQRAELLYSIMKVKGELEKRGKESQKKE